MGFKPAGFIMKATMKIAITIISTAITCTLDKDVKEIPTDPEADAADFDADTRDQIGVVVEGIAPHEEGDARVARHLAQRSDTGL